MKRPFFFILLVLLAYTDVFAQELFPYAEAASTQPKGIPGIRFSYENFRELPSLRARYWNEVRLVYGITEKLTTSISITGSNHHQKRFPKDLNNFFMNHHQRNFPQNPYLVEGFIARLKYRCISIDGHQKHLRMALFGAAAKSLVPHEEAEPHLGDNSGVEGGLIATALLKRFAISFMPTYLYSFAYKDPAQNIRFKAGNSMSLNTSLGYRLFPSVYSDYNNLNVNLYLEFITKSYSKAEMTVNGEPFSFEPYKNFDLFIYNSLQGNSYTEVRPSIQFIFYSTTRLELGVAHPVYSQSYLHFYPLYFISLQKNFYPSKKQKLPFD